MGDLLQACLVLVLFGAAVAAGMCSKPPGFPAGVAPDLAPRPFAEACSTPSSVHLTMDATGVTYNGPDEDQIVVDIISQGPIPWSISRFNQGDLSPRLGPRWQASQANLGVRAPRGGSSLDYADAHCSQAWRPHRRYGIVLPTVARNGQDWGDGRFYGTASISTQSAGFGYSMVDGSFGPGDCDVVVGKAGHGGEADIDVAASWIPYEAGFPSGYVAAPRTWKMASWQEPGAHSPVLSEAASEVVQWVWGADPRNGGNHSVVTIPGRSTKDGMLFATCTDGGLRNNANNIVGVRPAEDNLAWQVQIHEDFDPSSFRLAPMTQWTFAFLFVPWVDVSNLHAVHVNGLTGMPHRVAGAVIVKRVGKGRYCLRVADKGPLDGVLMLQCAARHSMVAGTSNGFLSYEWSDVEAAFMVEVRHTATGPSGSNRFPQSDADFYALWMDHRNPPTMTPLAYRGSPGNPTYTAAPTMVLPSAQLAEGMPAVEASIDKSQQKQLHDESTPPELQEPLDVAENGPVTARSSGDAARRDALRSTMEVGEDLVHGETHHSGSHGFPLGILLGVLATLCVGLVLPQVYGGGWQQRRNLRSNPDLDARSGYGANFSQPEEQEEMAPL
mmetsp:Transcript_35505/g.70199  ORF Transcript_35505/g.70199 Transcript_35505/m.70199 type:complete len:612 (-) Transcript_35505:13-1848(-)